jgi:transposase
MESHLVWFSDEQWAKIEPHLPANHPGPERKDDRLILSGIMHVLKVGCRWADCPKAGGPTRRSTIALPAGASEASGRRYSRRLRRRPSRRHKPRWIAAMSRFTAAPAAEKGAEFQAIGFTKGGRNSKIHAIVDADRSPWVLILTPGNTADWVMAQEWSA